MSDVAIRVENLSKLYKIGRAQQRHDTLRDALVDAGSRLGDRFRRNGANGHADDDTFWALKDVSFEVKRGEVVGIIGRNGAGKSTLLKILSQITEPTSGRAEIHGRVGSLLEVGTGFHPELTGRENIFLNGAILGMRREEIQRQFDEIVAFAEIEKFLDTPVKRYSSGMYVRLAFAVAAHLEPEILLVDEVLAVGDAQFQKKALGKMGNVVKEGRTVMFVSHNLIALRSLCPKAIWLDAGRMEQDGDSQKVIEGYLQLQSSSLHEQIWEDPQSAPGNETFRLRRIWLQPKCDDLNSGIPREVPLHVGVEYWQLDPTTQIHVTLQFSVEQQVIAFATSSAYDPNWHEGLQRYGVLRSTCEIPASFLNTGLHRVRLLIVQDRSRVIYTQEDALVFDVVETDRRIGAWFGKVAGIVRPEFPWHTEFLGTNEPILEP